MTREIEFRGRRLDNGHWVYGRYFRAPLTDENSGMPAEAGWFFLSGGDIKHCIESDGIAFVIDVETLGEYTGLNDNNANTEIYECDIIDVNGQKVGNVYENKELLKDGVNHVIARMGTSEWAGSEQEAIKRGCRYA